MGQKLVMKEIIGNIGSANDFRITQGCLHIFQLFDVGEEIDLRRAAGLLHSDVHRPQLGLPRKQPEFFGYDPPPVRFSRTITPVKLGNYESEASAEITLWDFGGISVCYRTPLLPDSNLSALVSLSCIFAGEHAFEECARGLVEQLVTELGAAITKPAVATSCEDYIVFVIEKGSLPLDGEAFKEQCAPTIAQILTAEEIELSRESVWEALRHSSSYSRNDLVVANWRGALIYGWDDPDTRAVLEFAAMQYLQTQLIDEHLDRYFEEAYRIFNRRFSFFKGVGFHTDIRLIGRLHVEAAKLFEAVNNALKLVGEQYLTHLYNLASARFELPTLHATVRDKLETLDDLYEKVRDRRREFREHWMEMTVIILIALEFEQIRAVFGNIGSGIKELIMKFIG